MNFVNETFYSKSIKPTDLEKEINQQISSLKSVGRKWFAILEIEKLQILFALVDYWSEVFELSKEQKSDLLHLASLSVNNYRAVDKNATLKRCPLGVVQIDKVTDQNLLPLLMVNLVCGNVVLVKNYKEEDAMFKIMANLPFPGLINFIQSENEINLLVDKCFQASDNVKYDHLVDELSVRLNKEEWQEYFGGVQSMGY